MSDAETPDQTRAVLWSSRVLRRSLFDADGSTVGTVHDVLLAPASASQAPTLRGFVVHVDRRNIFVHEARVDALDRDGVHLRGGTVDLRQFKKRPGELLVSEDIIGAPTELGPIADVGFLESERANGRWVIHEIAAGGGGRVRRRPVRTLPWSHVASRYVPDAVIGDLAQLRDLHKADAAEAIQGWSDDRKAELAAALDASRLADVLEEMPEEEQVEIIAQLDTEDAIAVLDEMETDDEIDLLKQMTSADREHLLAEMPEDEVVLLRSLLSYQEDTAGGMMNPEAVILSPETFVAEGVARLRDAQLPPALMVRTFVTETPTVAPTGQYLGTVTLPRLLKEPPTHRVGDCMETEIPTVAPSTPESEVAEILARYDLLAVPVVDAAQRLVGVVTVDDVLVRLVEGSRA